MSFFIPLISAHVPRRFFLVDSRGVSAMCSGPGYDETPKTIGSIFPIRQPNSKNKNGDRFTKKTN